MARIVTRRCEHPRGVLALDRHRGHSGTLDQLRGRSPPRVRVGINSTEKLYLWRSPGCRAPTPTTCRATFSPRSLAIDTTTQYSHCSSRTGWLIVPSTLSAEMPLVSGSVLLALNRK